MAQVSFRVVQPLLMLARERGLDPRYLLRDCGLPCELQLESRLPEPAVARLCELSVQRSGDPAFALRAGLSAAPGSLGALGYVLQNSPTLRAAYAHLQRYWRFLHDEPLFQIEDHADRVSLFFRRDSQHAAAERQALMEYLLSFLLRLSGSLVGGELRGQPALRCLSFRFPEPASARLAAYHQLLGCRQIRFEQERTGLEFDPALFSQQLPFADPDMLALFEQQLRQRLGSAEADIVQRVRGMLRARFPGHLPRLPELAHELAMSRASLQRRLSAAGSSYRAIVEQLRRETADELLADSRHSLGEIAFMLGFADAASFHHAYKRWTGQTPQQARSGRAA